MTNLCGNTQAEIDNDRPTLISKEEWEIRHERLEKQLQARKEFIAKLLRNETAKVLLAIDSRGVETYQNYFLHEAIEQIKDESFWDYEYVAWGEGTLSFDEWFESDPEAMCAAMPQWTNDKFKSLIQHEVEKLSDYVRF